MGNTPVRTIRIDDATWAEWQAMAVRSATDVSDLIRGAMEAAASEKKPTRQRMKRALIELESCLPELRERLSEIELLVANALDPDPNLDPTPEAGKRKRRN